MAAQVEIIDKISEICGIGRIGLLSPDTPYSLTFAGGREIKRYLGGSAVNEMNIQLLGQGENQKETADRLCKICDTLVRIPKMKLPKAEDWEIRRISIGTPPSLKGMDAGGLWFFACVIKIEYFTGG